MVNNCKGIDKSKGFITDGEVALQSSLKSKIKKAVPLRCIKHFHANCTEELRKIGIIDAEIQQKFLEPVFGTSSEFTAVVDSEDKYELRALLDSLKPKFKDFERRALDKEKGYESRFWKYIN